MNICSLFIWQLFYLVIFIENEPQLHSYHIDKQYDKVLFESFENRRSQHLHERLRLYILAKVTRLWQVFILALVHTALFECDDRYCELTYKQEA